MARKSVSHIEKPKHLMRHVEIMEDVRGVSRVERANQKYKKRKQKMSMSSMYRMHPSQRHYLSEIYVLLESLCDSLYVNLLNEYSFVQRLHELHKYINQIRRDDDGKLVR